MADNQDDIYKYQPLWENWYIDMPIGKGSFGSVYKISHEDMGHKYTSAVKIISIPSDEQYKEAETSLGGDEASLFGYFEDIVHNIINEINMLYTLKGNSNIVGYEDHKVVKKEDRVGWDILIRMEYVTSLRKYIAGHQMSKKEIIQLGIDVCSALELCSKKGIIHRDIKDDNIFVNQDGVFKLGDFGISKELSKSGRAASMRGTPLYMAPEVFRGDKYDAAVDIYSLGIVIYRLLNHGRMPFMPPYPETIRFKDSEDALEKRMSGQQLPLPDQAGEALGNVIIKACAYQAGDRYATPTEMKRDLERVLSNLPDASKDEPVTMLNTKSQESAPTNQSAITSQPEQKEKTVSIFGAGLTESTELPQRDLNKTESIFGSRPEPTPSVDHSPKIKAGPKKSNKPPKAVITAIAAIVLVVLIIAVAMNRADKSTQTSSQSSQTSTNTTAAPSKDAAVVNTNGNSSGNISNGGLAAQQGDWIYYTNNPNNELYKVRRDGTGRTKLNSDYSNDVNVDGDWIYYQNSSDNGTLYKIQTDGTERTKLNSDLSSCTIIKGDWVYYCNESDNCTLYTIGIDGTGKTKLMSDRNCFIFGITGDWIYYSDQIDNWSSYKIRTDGTGKTKLTIDFVSGGQVVGDWIYYRNGRDNYSIYKIRMDGTGRTKLNSDYSGYVNVSGDWIYYQNCSDNRILYKIRIDGTGKTKLNSDKSYCIDVVDDWIYYRNGAHDATIYKIRTDGTDRQKVE